MSPCRVLVAETDAEALEPAILRRLKSMRLNGRLSGLVDGHVCRDHLGPRLLYLLLHCCQLRLREREGFFALACRARAESTPRFGYRCLRSTVAASIPG